MNEIAIIIKDIQEAKGPKQKMAVLEKHKDNLLLQKTLFVTYNRKFNYGISSPTIVKLRERAKTEEIAPTRFNTIFDLLEELNNNNINNLLRDEIVRFLQNNSELAWLYSGMIINDIAIGIGITSINKVIKNLIPTFGVQLAGGFKPELLNEGEYFTLTEKLNGIRCVALNTNEMTSRQGKTITGMSIQIEQLKELRKVVGEDYIFDGELIHRNDDNIEDNANFRRTTSIVNSDAETKPEIIYRIFDIITSSDFANKKSELIYSERRKKLDALSETIKELNLANIEIVPALYMGNEQDKIIDYLDEYVNKGKEGIMLNKNDSFYLCKRHSGILKIKKMKVVDLLVLDVVEGRRNMQGTLGAVIVDYKGFTVNVGSGFSKEQREMFWKYPEMIKGRIIEVQYFEETKSKNSDKLSIQFPVFKRVRDDKTEPSYN